MLRLLSICLFACCCQTVLSQGNSPGDSNVINAAYNRQITVNGDLYYGKEHTGYSQKLIGTAYYGSNEWQAGSVSYNGTVYNNVKLKYDLVKDELIVLHPNNFFAVTLYSEKVKSFSIGNDVFVYVPRKNTAGLKTAGFYQQLVAGRLTVLAKRTKRIEEKTTTGELERTIAERSEYWAVKEGLAHAVNGEESVLALVQDQARKIRSSLREKGIRFRKAKEMALVEIATIYNQSAD